MVFNFKWFSMEPRGFSSYIVISWFLFKLPVLAGFLWHFSGREMWRSPIFYSELLIEIQVPHSSSTNIHDDGFAHCSWAGVEVLASHVVSSDTRAKVAYLLMINGGSHPLSCVFSNTNPIGRGTCGGRWKSRPPCMTTYTMGGSFVTSYQKEIKVPAPKLVFFRPNLTGLLIHLDMPHRGRCWLPTQSYLEWGRHKVCVCVWCVM